MNSFINMWSWWEFDQSMSELSFFFISGPAFCLRGQFLVWLNHKKYQHYEWVTHCLKLLQELFDTFHPQVKNCLFLFIHVSLTLIPWVNNIIIIIISPMTYTVRERHLWYHFKNILTLISLEYKYTKATL